MERNELAMLMEALQQQQQPQVIQGRGRRAMGFARPSIMNESLSGYWSGGVFVPQDTAAAYNARQSQAQQIYNQRAVTSNQDRNNAIYAQQETERQAYMAKKAAEQQQIQFGNDLGQQMTESVNTGWIDGKPVLQSQRLRKDAPNMETMQAMLANMPLQERAKLAQQGRLTNIPLEDRTKWVADNTKNIEAVQDAQYKDASNSVMSGQWFPNKDKKWFKKVKNPDANELNPGAPKFIEEPLSVAELATLAKSRSRGYIDIDSIYDMLNSQQPSTQPTTMGNVAGAMATPKGEQMLAEKQRNENLSDPYASPALSSPSAIKAFGAYMGNNPLTTAGSTLIQDLGNVKVGLQNKAHQLQTGVKNLWGGLTGDPNTYTPVLQPMDLSGQEQVLAPQHYDAINAAELRAQVMTPEATPVAEKQRRRYLLNSQPSQTFNEWLNSQGQ